MTVKRIAVIGAGQMGAGIAHVCAQSGYDVLLYDGNESALEKGVSTIERFLKRAVERERMTEEEKETTIANITQIKALSDITDVDLVIEAIVEQLDAKQTLFSTLDEQLPERTILATNTSALPITEIASVTKRPEKVIGMHFMNPVPVMRLVEIIRGLQTDDPTYETVVSVTKRLHKTAVTVKDFPGFVSNRVLMPLINEAIFAVYEGVASVEDVDAVMKLGMNHPMGPLELADMIGLDTCLYIMEVLYDGFGDPKYRPCPLLKQYVQAGWYGKKSGRGFYTYPREK